MNYDFLLSMKKSTRMMRKLSTEKKNAVLLCLSDLVTQNADKILEANTRDVAQCISKSSAFIDRLTLNKKRIAAMVESLRQVANAVDPVSQVVSSGKIRSGVSYKKVRSPLGVVFVIFESRPNVITEAFSISFKAGNATLLKAGKESSETADVIYGLIRKALEEEGVLIDVFYGTATSDREWLKNILREKKYIDVVIPRGGDSLIEFVSENSRIPIIKNDRGLCHIYIASDADPEVARRIVYNAKVQRPGVCNSVETVLVDAAWAQKHLESVYDELSLNQVEWHVCPESAKILAHLPRVIPADSTSFDTEYLDLKINCKIVQSIDEAISHIEQHGSSHSEAIVTKNREYAKKFQEEVDAAAVYWNASTRFTDGFEMGLGGEIGISTQKLHVRGPVGIEELTSVRWILDGEGQVRE